MKKFLALLLACMMIVPALASAQEISLWTYPVGSWGSEEEVNKILEAFNAQYPDITVKVEYLSYTDGDQQVAAAIEAQTAPDIVMEGPERLVTNWGANGKMFPINDLWTEETTADIVANNDKVEAACKNAEGTYYEYPLCMTAHCMVINKKYFEAADAMQYIDEVTHTWTTEGFINACRALRDAGFIPGVVYCGGQGGDQGTRALFCNLYGAHYTNDDYTAYTMNSEEGIKGAQLLYDLYTEEALDWNPGIVASDEIQLFCNGTVAMGFCWNQSAAASNKATMADEVEVFPMAFPSDDGIPELCGGIWGFGLIDDGTGDENVEAAKTFIKFVCDDYVAQSVYTAGFFPVKASVGDIWTGTEKEINAEYSIFAPYLGAYYNVVGGWAGQRTLWWQSLQALQNSGDAAAEMNAFVEGANALID